MLTTTRYNFDLCAQVRGQSELLHVYSEERPVIDMLLLALLCVFALADAKVNLYITKAEMNRTLGIVAEMNYLEHGVVNNYSTKFPYRVDANINQVMFSWYTEVSDKPIPYALRAVASDVNVLPVIRIQPNGYMPTKPETFIVEYRCAGSRAGQFGIFLHVNISWPSERHPTYLTLKQEKICTSRDGRRLGGNLDDYDQHGLKMDHSSLSLLSGDQLFYVIIGAVSAVIFVVITLLYVYFRGNRKLSPSRASDISSDRRPFQDAKNSPQFISQTQPFLSPSPSYGPPAEVPKPSSLVSVYLNGKRASIVHERASNTVDINQALLELAADRNLFQVMPMVELEGTFGEIKWAIWCQNAALTSGDIDDEEDQASVDEAVLVKTLKPNADRRHFEKFLAEALVFHHVPPHPNLAQVCAAATFGSFSRPETVTDFPLLCYRHSGFGNLKKFLLRCRGIGVEESTISRSTRSKNGVVQTLRTHELVSMGKQLLKAIMHLHKYGIIHRDIAARNCIVSELPGRSGNDRLIVQLCDNALSRDFFPGDYHCLGDNDNRPIKWMAPETLRTNVYNSATDVWSFGVAMWEMLSCGSQPFDGIEPEEVSNALEKGIRLAQPYNCPDELYGVLYCCWHYDPLNRPSPDQVHRALEDFNRQLNQFI
ncbi:hypothetical protein QR680_018915 [Steinernema hermaphroditum]|uniref:Protein kinase domain-containing protein n=1 Tax=Steinernema hermaphroditum TaxID=289476 RepID=A0AA39HKD9_9BILA|nr:hypothetical protein QR680_018915 [Steinernema hermaphroditum]